MNARAPVVDNSHTANMSKNISYFVFQVKKQVWVMWLKLHNSIYLDTTPRKVQCTTDMYTPSVVERCWETFCKLAVRQYPHTGKTSITGSLKSTLFYPFMLLDTHTVLWRSKYQSWSGVWTAVEVVHCRAALCKQVLLGSGRGQQLAVEHYLRTLKTLVHYC